LNVLEHDLERFIAEEKKYFSDRDLSEPEEDTFRIEYHTVLVAFYNAW